MDNVLVCDMDEIIFSNCFSQCDGPSVNHLQDKKIGCLSEDQFVEYGRDLIA